MIICLNLELLSDEDLNRIHSEVWQEMSKRSTERMKNVHLNDEERKLVEENNHILAIKSFKDRNNCSLMDAKKKVDSYRDYISYKTRGVLP